MTGNSSSNFVMYFNSSDYPPYDNSAAFDIIYTNQTHTAIFGIILTIWTLFMNLLVIISNFCERKTCWNTFYLQIVNLSITNIVIGLFSLPLTVYSLLYPWELGEVLCKMWIIGDVLLPFASMLILIIMDIDRIVLLTYPKVYPCLFENCLKQIIMITPWLLSLIIVVPLWTHGALPYELDPGVCTIMITFSASIACTIITYFVPVFIMVLLTSKLLITRMKTYHYFDKDTDHVSFAVSSESSNQGTTCLTSEQRRQEHKTTNSVMALCLANFVLCIMWFPFHCVSMVMTLCTSLMCIPSVTLNQVITWAATASSGIIPLVFFADSNIRRGCGSVIYCIRRSDREAHNEVHV